MRTNTFKMTLLTLVPWWAYNMIDAGSYVYIVQLLGIAEGLRYLHTHEPSAILHGDLKGVCCISLSIFCST